VILVVALLDYPFQGALSIEPRSFETALQTFDRLSGR